ncbi:MAG: HDOD domain-containing protein [Gammaproteobacteria bacterium]|nr:HDOD domain-containing protein [Gammaproteobacteria bacterium]
MIPDISKFKLPSPSPEGFQIMEMLSEVNVDLSILSDVICRDPVLSATVMKYANSPLYRRVIEIKSVHKAVNLLGIRNVATIILIATMRSFSTPPSSASDAIWNHCTGVSALTRLIARVVDRSLQDKAEFLATIHDIGAMTLAVNLSNYDSIYQSAIDNDIALDQAEINALGYSHNDISTAALGKLKLPEEMTALIHNFHQRPALTAIHSDDDKVSAILSLAHQLESQVHGETRVTETMPESIETLTVLLNLSQSRVEDIIDEFEDILDQGF